MIVLHPTDDQYSNLNGYKHKQSEIIFIKDGSDRWVVGTQVLDDPEFEEVHDQLNELERIEFTPFPDPYEE